MRRVALWNQSNWPSILKEAAPGFVRTSSAQDKVWLCQLWQHEHSYQSWPTLLGCPGRLSREYEPLCANLGMVVQIPCASIDMTGNPVISGVIFDESRWFQLVQAVHPPEVCKERKALRLGDVGIAFSVYPSSVGHFVPDQLPNVLVLHRFLPPSVPIIIADSIVTRRYIEPLIARRIALPGRFRFMPLKNDGTVVHADSVYTTINSHFTNNINGVGGYLIARQTYAQLFDEAVPPARRNTIVLIDRGNKSRSIRNIEQVRDLLRKLASTYSSSNVGALRGGSFELQSFVPHPNNVSVDIDTFRRAALIIAPHGAGLSNMLFAAEGTPVIEVCYDATDRMVCPAMYAAMGTILHHPYWVVTGAGGYASPIVADLGQIQRAVTEALDTVVTLRSTSRRAWAAGGRADVDGSSNMATMVHRLQQRKCGSRPSPSGS